MEWRYCLLFAALIMVQSGCRSLSPGDAESPLEKLTSRLSLSETKSKPDATKQNNEAEPTRIAVIWKENILQSDGGRPKQGFTGRIYFYDQAGEVVKASGSLNVYGYEDSGDIKRVVPDKNFVFEADKFASHYSPSEIGHSYSIWIPWCDYGGFRKSITLVPVFKTSNGKIVQGTADYLSLSGKTPKAQNLEKTIASPSIDARNDRRSQQSQAEAFANSAAAYLKSRNAVRASQSIPVPQSISDHWAHSNNSRNQSAQASLPQAQTQAQQLINQASLNGVGVNQVHTYNQQLTNPTRYTRATQTATLGHPQAGQTFPVSTAPNAAQQPAPTFPPQHGHPQSLGFSSQSLQTQQQPYAMQQPHGMLAAKQGQPLQQVRPMQQGTPFTQGVPPTQGMLPTQGMPRTQRQPIQHGMPIQRMMPTQQMMQQPYSNQAMNPNGSVPFTSSFMTMSNNSPNPMATSSSLKVNGVHAALSDVPPMQSPPESIRTARGNSVTVADLRICTQNL